MNWYLKVLKQYADFSGRARRQEYWMFTLFHVIIIFILAFASALFASSEDPGYSVFIILGIYILATFLPFLALSVRRLHDVGKSGWFYLINFVPYIGGFILLIFACMDGENKPNKWGENPKGTGNDIAINQIGRE
ncbi:DUF805 domain-containing protein [Polaribacter sp. SA4-12]|uniref:DUF805 domain-containing protein n=1 Tax=Polaribacter sp. SA4-12 TaxID=1312072 RepID=UPI000B3CE048|nr:DUF805 domain-containing protein [Polaribacter sp. SA4-12]ARV14180.1 hypothetical protein BTO07_02995 [Polaribacter sp. SA4-12]